MYPNQYYPSAGEAVPPPRNSASYATQGPQLWSTGLCYPSAGVAVPPPRISASYATQGPQLWSTGLCDCTGDCSSCCMTYFCPCVTFGMIAEFVDQGATCTSGALYVLLGFICCQWIYSCFYRSKMRAQFRLVERPCCDCLVHCFCEPCALCQEYRELKHHGFDMTIGWHGNMARRAQGMTVPPVMQMGMMR